MYSVPTVRQYESRSTPRMSRSFIRGFPPNPPVGNSRSRSHSVSPCRLMSKSGCLRWVTSSGLVSAIRWPRTRYAWISSCTRADLATSSSWPSAKSLTQRTGSYGIRSEAKIPS